MRRLVLIALVAFVSVSAFAQTLQDAQKEIVNENYFKAKNILYKLLKDPAASKPDVYYYLGNAYLKNDELDSAKVFYKLVFDPNTKTALGYVANGRLSLLAKNTADAKLNFDRATQITKSKNASVFFEIGTAYAEIEPGDLKAAETNLEQAFNLDNKNFAIVNAQGDVYNAQSLAGDGAAGGKAMNKYQYASDLDAKASLPHIKQGRIWLNGKVYASAIEEFQKALSIDPTNANVYKELGTAYYLSKQYDKMLENFKKYLDLSPGDCRARLSIILVYWKNKDYEKVAEEAAKGLTCDPNNFVFERYLYYSQYELKRYKEGYEAMTKFWQMQNIETRPTDFTYSAKLASQVGDTAAAMNYFATALKDDSMNCDLLGDYGKILFQAKRYPDAIRQYNLKRANCNKFSNIDLYYLGRAYISVQDSVNADSTFATYMTQYPTTIDGYYWRAQVNVRFKVSKEDYAAYPIYQKLIELAEKNPQANKSKLVEAYQYSAIYLVEKQKDTAGAKAYLQKALELDPNDQLSQDMMKQLQ